MKRAKRIITMSLCLETLLVLITAILGKSLEIPILSWIALATFYTLSNELDRKQGNKQMYSKEQVMDIVHELKKIGNDCLDPKWDKSDISESIEDLISAMLEDVGKFENANLK